MPYVSIALIVILLAIIIANIKIVPQSKAYVLEGLGAYYSTWQSFRMSLIPAERIILHSVKSKSFSTSFTIMPLRTTSVTRTIPNL